MRRIIFLETTKAAKDGIRKLETLQPTTDQEYKEASQKIGGQLAAKYFAMANEADDKKDPATAAFYRSRANSYVNRGREIAHPTPTGNVREDRFENLKRATDLIQNGTKAGVIRNPLKD